MTQNDNDALVCELLPCPVCGDKPKWRGSRHDYAAGIYRLQCLGETHLFQAYGASEEKCIAAWNARPPLTPQAKPLDPPAQDEVVLDALRDAYWAGAMAVHNAWVNDLGQNDPDFGEAASDYAQAAITALRQHQSAEIDALRVENARLREALENAANAIDEMFRYFDGGETRGSYDGKPERAQLRKAGYAVRAALTRRQG